MNSFGNRILKNLRTLRPWAAKFPCNAFRIYDRDIPEYAVSVDLYGNNLVVCRYSNLKFQERDEANFEIVLNELKEILKISEERIFVKERARQKGISQYQKVSQTDVRDEVFEGPLKFIVNLSDYLDTGLFLDHRASRKWVRENSAGKRVLNLFCYTATVSANALYGGATEVVSVDLSSTYLDWAIENFKLNQLDRKSHQVIRADVLSWLSGLPRSEKFDLIFLDPPSFSNSKKMKSDFDVQNDHQWMIGRCMEHLSGNGVLFFSNNLRSFKLSSVLTEKYRCTEITGKTLPPDFRNELIHHSWLFHHLES
jgi:23S rRNA (guanine2445-N2)-methyltransferase / 23S rRNA (guanine2069-N7)-methyltransferase